MDGGVVVRFLGWLVSTNKRCEVKSIIVEDAPSKRGWHPNHRRKNQQNEETQAGGGEGREERRERRKKARSEPSGLRRVQGRVAALASSAKKKAGQYQH